MLIAHVLDKTIVGLPVAVHAIIIVVDCINESIKDKVIIRTSHVHKILKLILFDYNCSSVYRR